MKPVSSVEANRQRDWAIDLIRQGTPPVQHLIVVDVSKKGALLNEPVRTFDQLKVVLERLFKRLGPPAKIMTDGDVQYTDDGFQQLLESFGVRQIVHTDVLYKGPVERFVRSKSNGKSN